MPQRPRFRRGQTVLLSTAPPLAMIPSPHGPRLLRPGQASLRLPVKTISASLVHNTLYLTQEGSPHIWALDTTKPQAQLKQHYQARPSDFMELIQDQLIVGDRRELTSISLEHATVSERFELIPPPAQLILYNTITPDDTLNSLYSFTPGLYDSPHTGVWRWRPGLQSERVIHHPFGRYLLAQDEPFVWDTPSPVEPTYELFGIDLTLQHPLGMHIEHISWHYDMLMLVAPRYIIWTSSGGQLMRSIKRRPLAMRLDLEHASLWWAQTPDKTRHISAREDMLIDAPLEQLHPLDGGLSALSWTWRRGKIELCGADAPPLSFPMQAQPLHLFWRHDERAFAITADYALVELEAQRDAQGVATTAATPWIEPPEPSGTMQALDVLNVLQEVRDPFLCSQVLHETLEPDELQWLCWHELPTLQRGFKVSLDRMEQWLEAPLLSSLNPGHQAQHIVKIMLDEQLIRLAPHAHPRHLEIIVALAIEAYIDEPLERAICFEHLVERSHLLLPSGYELRVAFHVAAHQHQWGAKLWLPESNPFRHLLADFQRWSIAQKIERPILESLIFYQALHSFAFLDLIIQLRPFLNQTDLHIWTQWCEKAWAPWALTKAQELIDQELVELAPTHTAQALVPALLTNLLDRRGEAALGEALLDVEGVEELFADDRALLKLIQSAQHWDEVLLKALSNPVPKTPN